MSYHKLILFLFNVFFIVTLSGCGATLLSYKPSINPNVLDAMQSIRKLILSQPEEYSPTDVHVTENYFQIKGEFEGDKSLGGSATALIRYSSISEITFHHKNEWFLVSLIGNNMQLFRYHTFKESDAKKLMDSFYTMMEHKADPYKPISFESHAEVKSSVLDKNSDVDHSLSKNIIDNNSSKKEELSVKELDRISEQLKELKELKDSNILSTEEYDAKKSVLIEKIQ